MAMVQTSERHFPNEEYENLFTTRQEAATDYLPNRQKVKYRDPCESKTVKEKRDNIKKSAPLHKRNATPQWKSYKTTKT